MPVGPYEVYKRYFQECIDSLKTQIVPFDEVLLIDDMAHLEEWTIDYGNLPVHIHKNPWLSGVAHSLNFGVALAENDLVMFLGSDDRAQPWLCQDLHKAWEKHYHDLGFYHCDVEYDDGEQQGCACGAAMVTKKLWNNCGGFPIESSVGACDSMLISIFLVNNMAGTMYRVESHHPPIWYRRHMESLTGKSGPMQNPIFHIRNYLPTVWDRPKWTR